MIDARIETRQLAAPAPSGPSHAEAINFICIAPEAKEVFLVGDFNNWQPAGHPMKRNVDGSWHLSVSLGHGGHHYQFLIDGQRKNDPRAQGLARNAAGEKVSMLMVS